MEGKSFGISALCPAVWDAGLESMLGFGIGMAHGASRRRFADLFADLGLTQKQVALLWLIAERPGIAQTDLAQRLRVDRATIMATVNRLQARGFLRRARATNDGRRQSLHVEPAGEAMLVKARQVLADHEAWLMQRYSPGEAKMLIGLLARIQD